MHFHDRLFEPLSLGDKLTLRNRLVMAPMTTVSGNPDGSFSDEEIAYLERRASSGIGLVMTPACYVHKSGHSFERQVGCHSDDMLPRLSRCADAINRQGAASFLQIHHGGNAARSEYSGRPPMAPSAVMNRRGTSEMPAAMTEDEIWMIIESFAAAAGRANKAGFTGVEIHGANTYLFQQFFSPFTNKRTDKWGGDLRCDRCDRHQEHDRLELCHRLENRARFALEVVKAVRGEVGPDYPVAYRVSPEEPDPDGYSTHDAIQLLSLLLPLGIDIVHVSSWQYGVGLRYDWHSGTHPTKMISDAMPDDIPVIGVGSILTPGDALRVRDDGVELVSLGRALLLDADWVTKSREGRGNEIRTAIHSEEERQRLDIPPPMREYTKRSIQIAPVA
ncbi:MAG: NADH-dependent flavin oxidoreductase [candidate division Zixibacteria bacterium]|nr:NADH-dependent flavin oxidoreductase [candidate division Zixibacteria bacterium]